MLSSAQAVQAHRLWTLGVRRASGFGTIRERNYGGLRLLFLRHMFKGPRLIGGGEAGQVRSCTGSGYPNVGGSCAAPKTSMKPRCLQNERTP